MIPVHLYTLTDLKTRRLRVHYGDKLVKKSFIKL